MNELPAEPILQGVLWTWIVPALVFLIATASAGLLYRHFAKQTVDPSENQTANQASPQHSPQGAGDNS